MDIIMPDKSISTDPQTVLNGWKESLSSMLNPNTQFTNNTVLPEDASILNGTISVEEVTRAIYIPKTIRLLALTKCQQKL